MPRSASIPKKILAFALVACLVLGIAGFLAVRGKFDQVRRVRLRVEAREGLDGAERTGLEQLLIHQLEVQGGMPVLRWPEPGVPEQSVSGAELYLEVAPRKQGTQLGFELAWSWGRGQPQQNLTMPFDGPDAAMNRLFRSLPLGLRNPAAGQAWPRQANLFWMLVGSMGLIDIRSEGARSLVLANTVAARAPDCAEAQLNLGIHLYSQLQWSPSRDSVQLDRAVACFEAGLALQPGHPRGTRDLVLTLTDTGRGKEAFDLLAKAIAMRPGVPRLYEALAYASRVGGLLELSQGALRAQHRLALGQTRQVGETTLLYLEDWSGFLDTCSFNGRPIDTKAGFYQGYAALAHGDREGALRAFHAAQRVKEGWYGFEDLSAVLALHLEGRTDEARVRVAALDQSRVGLRIPDGEFTFKQAEANAVLGSLEEAMDLADRAFSQGFCCVRWYEKSPFLGPLRAHPRWADLMQRARERQANMNTRYKANQFGL
jgi:hypothetical protein